GARPGGGSPSGVAGGGMSLREAGFVARRGGGGAAVAAARNTRRDGGRVLGLRRPRFGRDAPVRPRPPPRRLGNVSRSRARWEIRIDQSPDRSRAFRRGVRGATAHSERTAVASNLAPTRA